jgi:uncharacterized protein with HEPN domain
VKDDRERVLHILEAIQRVEKYAGRGRAVFDQDELIQNWMVWHLQVIGEAARALSESFRSRHPEIPWANIIGMRHIIVHEYFGIDLAIVWQSISVNLPDLKRTLELALRDLEWRV